eukprot:gene12110-14166_t
MNVSNDQDMYDDYDEDDDYEWTEQDRLEYEARMKKSDEVSAKMGEKLLLGWTLLGDTPLMRDRDKIYHCVACNGSAANPDDLRSNIVVQSKPTVDLDQTTPSASSKMDSINNSQMPDVVDRTLSTLLDRLKEAECRLSDSTTSASDTKFNFQLVRECAMAISSMLELKKHL